MKLRLMNGVGIFKEFGQEYDILKLKKRMMILVRNGVFATNSDFLILLSVSLQTNVVEGLNIIYNIHM